MSERSNDEMDRVFPRLPRSLGYPTDAQEVIGPRRYRQSVKDAVKKFRHSKPWRGTHEEREAKFQTLVAELCAAYGIQCRLEVSPNAMTNRNSFNSNYAAGRIRLTKFSVVTILHEFAHALGKDERGACDWSINLFRIMFPNSFRRCRFDGHLVLSVRPALPRTGTALPAPATPASVLPADLRPAQGESAEAFLTRLISIATSRGQAAVAAPAQTPEAAPVQTPEAAPAQVAEAVAVQGIAEAVPAQAVPVEGTVVEQPLVAPVQTDPDEVAVVCECLSLFMKSLRQAQFDTTAENATKLAQTEEDIGDLIESIKEVAPLLSPA